MAASRPSIPSASACWLRKRTRRGRKLDVLIPSLRGPSLTEGRGTGRVPRRNAVDLAPRETKARRKDGPVRCRMRRKVRSTAARSSCLPGTQRPQRAEAASARARPLQTLSRTRPKPSWCSTWTSAVRRVQRERRTLLQDDARGVWRPPEKISRTAVDGTPSFGWPAATSTVRSGRGAVLRWIAATRSATSPVRSPPGAAASSRAG